MAMSSRRTRRARIRPRPITPAIIAMTARMCRNLISAYSVIAPSDCRRCAGAGSLDGRDLSDKRRAEPYQIQRGEHVPCPAGDHDPAAMQARLGWLRAHGPGDRG